MKATWRICRLQRTGYGGADNPIWQLSSQVPPVSAAYWANRAEEHIQRWHYQSEHPDSAGDQ
jgi:hypothetical protein